MRAKLVLTAAFVMAAVVVTEAADAGHARTRGNRTVRVVFASPAIDLYHSASVRVSGLAARSAEVRLVGAIDRAGLAYEWKPYRWQVLRVQHGAWRGRLPAPPLLGIYRLQLRVDDGRRLLTSTEWLLPVVPVGTMQRASFPRAVGAVRDFVAHLPGHEVLVASKRWPLSSFDHRDPRLNRLFVIAYAPRGDRRPSSRLGLFVTTIRDGYHGRWRILQATTQPYD
jgi:hypothetical protein